MRAAAKVNYYLIASPAGAYFSGGITPLEIWLSSRYTRAGHGGMGQAKTGGNYASSLVAQAEAYENGCQQVLFLDADAGWLAPEALARLSREPNRLKRTGIENGLGRFLQENASPYARRVEAALQGHDNDGEDSGERRELLRKLGRRARGREQR